MRIIRLHKRPTPELRTAEGCVKGLLESSTGQENGKSLKSAWMVGRQGLNSHPRGTPAVLPVTALFARSVNNDFGTAQAADFDCEESAGCCLAYVGFLERHTRHSCNAYKRQFSLRGTGSFRRRNLALEQLHLDLGVLPDNMVRSPSAIHAKPFLNVGIPADVQMFHIILLSNALSRLRQAPLSLFGDTLCFPIAFLSAG
jgi:hypothetical protein